jgi:methyl-accepting chemotaxis protein
MTAQADTQTADDNRTAPEQLAASVAGNLRSLSERLPLKEQLEDLATVLERLHGDQPDFDRARLWASTDLFGAFLGDGNDVPEGGWFWRLLESTIQVGVFVPVAVTWVGLALAAWAYRAAENAGTLGSESFLQGWEKGFGKLPVGLTFDWFAIYTCVLITILIIMTSAHVWHRSRAGQDEAEARRKLTNALVWADLILAPYRLPAEQRAAQELNAASDKVAALVSAFDAAAGKMTTTAKAVGTAAGKMTVTAGAFDTAAGKVTATITAADTAAGKMATTAAAFDTAAGTMTTAADKVTATAGAVDTAAGKMTATAAAFDTAAGTMATAAGNVATSVGAIDTAAATINTTAGAIESTAKVAVASQQKATDAIGAASAAMAAAEGAASAAGGAARVLESASVLVGNEVGRLATVTGQARDSLADVADTVGYHASRVEAVGDILGKAQLAIDKLPTAVTTLQGEVTAIGGQLVALNQVTTAMNGLQNSLDATGTSSDRIAAAFTDGSDAVRDFLTRTSANAADTASRVEAAADILGKAQLAIDSLPDKVDVLAQQVTGLSGQLADITDVITAIGELRASLDRVRTSLDAGRTTRRSPPSSPPPSPPPQSPPQTGRTGIFKVFRRRGTPSGK